MKISPEDNSVYLTYIGNEQYQLFIKNISADADFTRVVIGYTEMIHRERVAKVMNSWIISPLQAGSEPHYLLGVSKILMNGRRVWVAFQAVKRGKKNLVQARFMAISLNSSRWRKTIGSLTHFNIGILDPFSLYSGTEPIPESLFKPPSIGLLNLNDKPAVVFIGD